MKTPSDVKGDTRWTHKATMRQEHLMYVKTPFRVLAEGGLGITSYETATCDYSLTLAVTFATSACLKPISSGLATATDEYVPNTMPASNA